MRLCNGGAKGLTDLDSKGGRAKGGLKTKRDSLLFAPYKFLISVRLGKVWYHYPIGA